jgi:hypothetical protein
VLAPCRALKQALTPCGPGGVGLRRRSKTQRGQGWSETRCTSVRRVATLTVAVNTATHEGDMLRQH